MKNYELELPLDYKAYYIVDAKKKSTAIIFNGLSFLIFAVIFFAFLAIKKPEFKLQYDNSLKLLFVILIYMASLIGYIILHELTHGICYKLFTKEKLTFGLNLSCAYCGVPQVYLRKWPAIISALAPFVIFNLVFILTIIWLPANIYALLFIILLGLHNGGCIGDLYVSFLMLFKLPKDFLVNDNGYKQVFYVKEVSKC